VWYIAVLLAFMSFAGTLTMVRANAAPDPGALRAQALVFNGAVYKEAALAYAAAHLGTIGSIPDGSLGLPAWYQNFGWTNTINGPWVTVYLVSTSGVDLANLASPLSQLLVKSQLAGVARNGVLNVSGAGNYAAVLPPGVPSGSPVFIGQAYYSLQSY